MIGDDVEVTVLDIRGDKVRLGIRAPSKVPVHRKEVYLAIREENARAAEAGEPALHEAVKLYKENAHRPPAQDTTAPESDERR